MDPSLRLGRDARESETGPKHTNTNMQDRFHVLNKEGDVEEGQREYPKLETVSHPPSRR